MWTGELEDGERIYRGILGADVHPGTSLREDYRAERDPENVSKIPLKLNTPVTSHRELLQYLPGILCLASGELLFHSILHSFLDRDIVFRSLFCPDGGKNWNLARTGALMVSLWCSPFRSGQRKRLPFGIRRGGVGETAYSALSVTIMLGQRLRTKSSS